MSVRAPSGTQSQGLQSSQGRGRSHSAGVCPARVPEVQSSSRPRRPLSAPLVRGGRAAVSLVFSAPDRAHVPLGGGRNWRFTMRVNVFVL